MGNRPKTSWLSRLVSRLEGFVDHWWYVPLIAVLSALDAYLLVIPNEALLVPAVLAHPSRWARIGFWTTLGSAVGATSFAALTGIYGTPFIERLMPGTVQSKGWTESMAYLQRSGSWGLGLVSLGPFPQHAAVAVAGLARMPLVEIFLAVFGGRLIKYLFVSWCAAHSPGLLRKLGLGSSH